MKNLQISPEKESAQDLVMSESGKISKAESKAKVTARNVIPDDKEKET